MNRNKVVRRSGNVHRLAGPWSPTVQRFLGHLGGHGLDGVPRPLGFDERGREVVSYIPGEVVHDTPGWLWAPYLLSQAAHTLRRLHDASLDFPREGAVWGLSTRQPDEVVCHNDFAPYNCVFRARQIVGVIDFEVCAPGPRIWDLAYAAYRFVPLLPPAGSGGSTETSPFGSAARATRTERFLEEYAQGDVSLCYGVRELHEVCCARLVALADWTEARARALSDLDSLEHASMYREHARWLAGEGT